MGCCGQQRAALTESGIANRPPDRAGWYPDSATVRIEFKQRQPVMVRGPVTGKAYMFEAASFTQTVDKADAAPLIMSGYFRVG